MSSCSLSKDSKPVKATETVGSDPIVLMSNEAQTVPLKENDSTAKTAVSRVTINMSSSEFDKNIEPMDEPTEAAGIPQVTLLSNEMQAISLKGDNSTESPAASDVISPTFFNLLESVSPSLQADLLSVLLEKCTVLELSSLAAVSRSIRKGVLATMAKRSLEVHFSLKCICADGNHKEVVVMHIDDLTEPSRHMRIEFCNCDSKEYTCRPWKTIEKLTYFCGYANLPRVTFGLCPAYLEEKFPIKFSFKSDHGNSPEFPPLEVFVDSAIARITDYPVPLQFVSPREILVYIDDSSYAIDYLFSSRGMTSTKSVIFDCYDLTEGVFLVDDRILNLTATSIDFYGNPFSMSGIEFIWTPAGVSMFIEQWLQGSREINRVHCILSMNLQSPLDFGHQLKEALGKLNQPPQIDLSTALKDEMKDRLQTPDGHKLYGGLIGFSPDASIIRLTVSDGRKLTVVVATAWNNVENMALEVGFIDIFSSD